MSTFIGGGGPSSNFKLGFSTSFSGPYSIFGKAVRATVNLFVSDWNENGGLLAQNVDVTIARTEADATKAIEKALELVGEERIGIENKFPAIDVKSPVSWDSRVKACGEFPGNL